MKKVLLISDVLEHYRLPLYNSLTEDVNLTIASTSPITNDEALFQFEQIRISLLMKYGFIFYKNLPNFNDYDYVIFPFNVRLIFVILKFLFVKRKYKIFLFGIGVAASYTRKYDEKNFFDFVRKFLIKKVDGAIFYEKYPEIKYSRYIKCAHNKLSVAYNTVTENLNFNIKNKTYESFIFIGSLYKQKKIYELLEAYISLYKKGVQLPNLEIIGKGEEYENINLLVQAQNMHEMIIIHGEIIRDEELFPIMNRAIVCFSPGQAGLSVQKCFSYGIGFVTSSNAITGGELFSIIDNVTGDIYDGTREDLMRVMLKYTNQDYMKKISDNAFTFYKSFRNVKIWKEGFLKNIK